MESVPGLGVKRNAGLTYLIFASISLKDAWERIQQSHRFFPRFKSNMEVIFLNVLVYHQRFYLWMSDTLSKRRRFSFIFNLGNKAKSQGGQVRGVERLGNDNHVVVSRKLCGFQGRV
jgi:hypothetical protein